MTCIQARGLHKSYGSSVALNSIDLNVAEGRILGLIGPNGAGKTTLLNAILGLTSYQGDAHRPRPQSLDPARSAHERRSLRSRRRRPPPLDARLRRHRLRRRHPSPLRPHQGRSLPRPHHHQAHQQSPRALQGHGRATPPRLSHVHRRQASSSRRAHPRPRHPLPQAVLRLPAQRLLRSPPHHPHHHPPNR